MAKFVMPSGAVVAFAGVVAPSGWLMCDGAQVSRTKYRELFSVIGTSHGYGNNRTTFHLPDYRGRFLRGVDLGAGNDPDAASRTAVNTGGNTGDSVGSVQSDQVIAHTHLTGARSNVSGGGGGQIPQGNVTNSYADNLSTGSTGGNETRPKNVGTNWIIKT